jgi:hypothetical protein
LLSETRVLLAEAWADLDTDDSDGGK